MRPVLTLLGLLVVAAPLDAQASWVASVGMERYDQADALASPLRYGALAPSLTLAWHHDGRTLSGVELAVARARLTTDFSGPDTHFIDAWTGALAAHWLRRMANGHWGEVHVGATLDVFLSVRQQTYRTDVATELFGDAIAGLQATATWTLTPAAGHRLRQEFAVPVLSAVLRTPYTGAKYVPPLAWGGPGRLRGIRYDVEYARDVSAGFALGARYTLDAWHYPDPRSFSVVRHRLGAVIRWGTW